MTLRRSLFAFAALALMSASARAGAPCHPDLVQGTRYPAGNGVAGLSAVDLNGDGDPDLLMVTAYPQVVDVRLGNADGTFGPSVATPIDLRPYEQLVGKFTDDDVPDLVLRDSSGLWLLVGNGDGTFLPPVQIGQTLYSVFAADVNSDGKLDVLGHESDSYFDVLLGNGNGTFQAPIQTPLKLLASSYAIGDVDGDGKPDLVASGYLGDLVAIYPGVGDGHWETPHFVAAGASLSALNLVDMNGDGDLDMVLASGSYVGVLLGNGDGTFQAARDYGAGRAVSTVRIGDLNGDGLLDLVAFIPAYPDGYELSSFRTFFGRADGSFATGQDFLVDLLWADVALADFGNDGTLDLAAAAVYTESLDVHPGFGDGTFQALPYTRLSDGGHAPASGDFNEDGRMDVALSGAAGVVAYLGAGGGRFVRSVPTGTYYTWASATADFNEDGHLDLAAAEHFEGSFVVLGNGDGTFGPAAYFPIAGGAADWIASGDFDGDGHADFCIANVGVFGEGMGLTVYFGRGDGTFDSVDTPMDFGAVGVLAGDFNGDGRTDVAVLQRTPDALVLFLANADRTFQPPAADPLPTGPLTLTAGDFRHLDRLDVIVAAYGSLLYFPNQGDGTFAAPIAGALPENPSFLAVADLNGDGDLDLATNGEVVWILFGDGNGGFGPPQAFAAGASEGLLPGDADGNGKTDLVLVSSEGYLAAITALMSGSLGVRVPDAGAIVGTAATLAAHASGYGPLTYQWRKGGVPLSDGGSISGSQTGTLTIDPVSFDDAGSYDVLVSDSCGAAGSNAATLSVEFADVPLSSPFHADILAVAAAGITAGCGGGDYCPTSAVRRDQMAVFLLKSEHGSSYIPPDCSGTFADVVCPGPFTDWVEQLALEGVTTGCGGDDYCPASSVTRAQMAVFLLKTKNGSAYVPPAATGIFNDVPVGSFAADFIENLYGLGISGGCSASPLLYCPGNPVLRQQMATFLVRTFSP